MLADRPPVPVGARESFWTDLDDALHPHDLTDELAADLAWDSQYVAGYVGRQEVAPAQLALASEVAIAAGRLRDALGDYDAFCQAAGILEDAPPADRHTLDTLLKTCQKEVGKVLPPWLRERGLVEKTGRRVLSRPVDSPIWLMALLTLTTLRRHGIALLCSDHGVTAQVLRITLAAVDEMRGQAVKPRQRLKGRIRRWIREIPAEQEPTTSQGI